MYFQVNSNSCSFKLVAHSVPCGRFCIEWCDSEPPIDDKTPYGWVLKAPFTTNNHCIMFTCTLHDISRCFYRFCMDDAFRSIPYLILQPRLANRKVSYSSCHKFQVMNYVCICVFVTTGIQSSAM